MGRDPCWKRQSFCPSTAPSTNAGKGKLAPTRSRFQNRATGAIKRGKKIKRQQGWETESPSDAVPAPTSFLVPDHVESILTKTEKSKGSPTRTYSLSSTQRLTHFRVILCNLGTIETSFLAFPQRFFESIRIEDLTRRVPIWCFCVPFKKVPGGFALNKNDGRSTKKALVATSQSHESTPRLLGRSLNSR